MIEINSYSKMPTDKPMDFIVYYDRGEKNNGKTNEFKQRDFNTSPYKY